MQLVSAKFRELFNSFQAINNTHRRIRVVIKCQHKIMIEIGPHNLDPVPFVERIAGIPFTLMF